VGSEGGKRALRRVSPPPLSGDPSHADTSIRRRDGHPPAFPVRRSPRQGLGACSRRDIARFSAGPGPRARQPCAPLRHGGRLRRLRRGRAVGVEGRLRGARGRANPVPAQIRRRHARPGGFPRGDARHAHARRRAAAFADAPLRGIPAPPAVLDPHHARLRRGRGRRLEFGRPRPGAVRWHGASGDLRRARQGPPHSQRNRRDARRAARPPVPRRRTGHKAQRRAHPRPSGSCDPAERRADEPAFLGIAACRGQVCRGRHPPCRLGARPSRSWRAARRHHRPQCRPRSAGLARELRAPAGEGPRRVHGDARRPGLRPPRHQHRDAADRHRPGPGRGPTRLSAVARDGHRRS
jgi:hypothetical protein